MKLILALVDLSEATSDVVTLAGKIAASMKSRLIVLHVAMPDAEFVGSRERDDVSRKGIAAELRRDHRKLEILQLELKKLGVDAMALMVRSDSKRGDPVGKIVQEINRMKPDLIVLGSHARSRLYQMIAGSVSDAVLRKVCCPLLLVPRHSPRA